MTDANNPTRLTGWLRQETANIPLLYRLNIHRRLALSFIFVIVMLLVGIGFLLLQLHLIRSQVERFNGVNKESFEVLHIHTGLLSVCYRLGILSRSVHTHRFV